MSKSEIKTKTIQHPMEEIFDIEENSTIVEYHERTTELVDALEYDDKDKEIEEQLQEIYDNAMGAFEDQLEEADNVEGKYKARNGEVAVQFLSAALNAAKEKATYKQHKDKIHLANKKKINPGDNTGLIVADRNELLRHLAKGYEEQSADQSTDDLKDDPSVIDHEPK